MRKRTSIKPGYYFCRLWGNIQEYYHTYGIWELLFIISSVSFVFYGILAQAMISCTKNILYTQKMPFLYYLLGLLIPIGVGSLIYFAVTHPSRRNRFIKSLTSFFLIASFLIEALCLLVCVYFYDDLLGDDEIGLTYTDWSYEDTHHKSLIQDSSLIGKGRNADAVEYHFEVSDREEHPLYPVVAHVYGFWILILFSIIAVVWICSAIRVYMRIYSRWHEWLFLLPLLMMAHLLITTILGFVGIIPCVEFCPFTGYPVISCFFPVPQLSVMCAVIKLNHNAI